MIVDYRLGLSVLNPTLTTRDIETKSLNTVPYYLEPIVPAQTFHRPEFGMTCESCLDFLVRHI